MPRLLVVEDNEMNISLMSTFLKQMGYDVVMAKNGEEALVQAMNAEPDIILMDLMMPDMDGWEAAERLRAEDTTRDIPVIAVSAFIDDHYKETKKLFDPLTAYMLTNYFGVEGAGTAVQPERYAP